MARDVQSPVEVDVHAIPFGCDDSAREDSIIFNDAELWNEFGQLANLVCRQMPPDGNGVQWLRNPIREYVIDLDPA